VSFSPRVAIIVLNWNGGQILRKCLTSLRKTIGNYKVIVVDNGSTDGSEKIVSRFPEYDLVRNKDNMGYSKGNNVGIRYAMKKYKPKYILLLNNDVAIADPKWLDKLIEVASRDGKIGIVGCKLLYPDGRIQHAGIRFAGSRITFGAGHIGYGERDVGQYDRVYEVQGITGACMLIKSEVLKEVGLLDERFTPYWYEDVDYSLRAGKKFKIMFVGTTKVIHLEGSTFKKIDPKSDNTQLLVVGKRNFMLCMLNHFGISKFFRAFLVSLFSSLVAKKDESIGWAFENVRIRRNFILKLLLVLKAALHDVPLLYKMKEQYERI